MKFLQTFLRLSLFLASTTGLSLAATVVNGSLDGAVQSFALPPGWSPTPTTSIAAGVTNPDTNDLNNPAIGGIYNPSIPPVVSSDGGTWVGFHDRRDAGNSAYNEGMIGSIEGLIVGQTYTVFWEGANFGAVFGSFSFNKNGFIQLEIAGNIYDGTEMALGTSWTADQYSFVATSTTEEIIFRAFSTDGGDENGFDGAYLSIDGIGVIPEVSTLWLLGVAGLWPLLTRRRS